MKKYFNHHVKKAIVVQSLITIESLELSSTFSYPKEVHEFYEFAYIDDGNLSCKLGDETIELSQGDFLLMPPKKPHFYFAASGRSATIFIVCFRCNSELLTIFDKKIPLRKKEKMLISEILKEAKNAFSFPFDHKLKQLSAPLFGAQQLVENHIERLLIQLIRNETNENENIKFVMNSVELENNLVNDIITLLKNNLYGRTTLEAISQQTYYSKTFLNGIFKKNIGYSIMQYYTILKIQEAKRLLRENVSPTAISNQLHFESPTYFTKVFKKHTNMTPSAYRKTIL